MDFAGAARASKAKTTLFIKKVKPKSQIPITHTVNIKISNKPPPVRNAAKYKNYAESEDDMDEKPRKKLVSVGKSRNTTSGSIIRRPSSEMDDDEIAPAKSMQKSTRQSSSEAFMSPEPKKATKRSLKRPPKRSKTKTLELLSSDTDSDVEGLLSQSKGKMKQSKSLIDDLRTKADDPSPIKNFRMPSPPPTFFTDLKAVNGNSSDSEEIERIGNSQPSQLNLQKITEDDLTGTCLVCSNKFRMPSTKQRRREYSLAKKKSNDAATLRARKAVCRTHRYCAQLIQSYRRGPFRGED